MESHFWRSCFSVVVICLCSGFVQMFCMVIVNNLYVVANKWYISFPNHNHTSFLHEWGLVASAVWLGMFSSTPFTVPLVDNLGRKRTMIVACIFYLIGACFICLIYPTKQLFFAVIGRFLTGAGDGLSITVSLLWVGELSPRDYRGIFISFIAASSGLGSIAGVVIPLPGILGQPNLWILALAFGNVVAVMTLPAILYLPESPRFLFYHNGLANETLKSIEFYHGSENLHSTLDELKAEQEICQLSLRDIMSDRRFKKSFILCILLTGFYSITGFIYILEFSTVISLTAGLNELWAMYTTTFLAGIKFAISFVVPWVVGRFNRRPVIQAGLYLSAACCISIALILAFFPKSSFTGITVFIVMIIFVPINAVLIGVKYASTVEVCTQEIRAVCVTCGRAVGSLLETAVTYPFLPLSAAIGIWPIFVFSALATVLLAIYFHKVLPETKNSTFRETADKLGGVSEEERPLLRRTDSELIEEIF